jgi:ribulose-phosphate 3-epimerase
MVEIAASILSLNLFSLQDMIKKIQDSIDYLHLDVMDGHLVPRITFGQQFIETIRNITDLPLDVHLMITNPEKQVESFIKAGGDRITVHIESLKDFPLIRKVTESYEKQLGLSISPNTPFANLLPYIKEIDSILVMTVHPGFSGQKFLPNTIKKIKEANMLKMKHELDFKIMVDGGINLNTATDVMTAGADILVVGSGLFSANDPLQTIKTIKAMKD